MINYVLLLDLAWMICLGHPVDLVDPEVVAASIGMDKTSFGVSLLNWTIKIILEIGDGHLKFRLKLVSGIEQNSGDNKITPPHFD